jgi:hypothetical protein
MSGQMFKGGQLVTCFNRESASGSYQVTQLLPPEGDVFQYRKKYQGAARTRGQRA